VHRRRLRQQVPDPPGEPAGLDQRGGLAADPGHPPGGHRQAGQLGQQDRRPPDRDMMSAGQVRCLRMRLGAVAGPRPHMCRQHPRADRPAARARLGLRHVPGHRRRRRRDDIGDLMAALQHDGRPGQARPAAAARSRGELQPLIGIIRQHQRRPRLAGLLARPPPAPLPQRPVPRLLLIRAVRGRRPRRGRGVLARGVLQVLHPCPQLPDQLVRPGQQRRQLSMREPLQLRRRGDTGHIRHSTQINPTAGPQSTTCHGVSQARTGTARRPGETPPTLAE
jgi:hypothetical protein